MNTSEIAVHAVRSGGQKALEYFRARDDLAVELKGPQDYVSQADREVEQTIIKTIQASFPDDGFVAEESGMTPGAREWVIDPIDGTTNFIRGIPYFCTTLALIEDECVQGGWIYDPIHDVLYAAERGSGAYANGEHLHPHWRSSFSTGLVGICHSSQLTADALAHRIKSALSRGAILRQPGAAALMLCDLACGRLDVLFDQHLKPWDSIAGLCIAHEAGAVVSHYLSAPEWRVTPQPTLAAGPDIYEEAKTLWPDIQSVPIL